MRCHYDDEDKMMVKNTFEYDARGFLVKDTYLCFERVERDVIRSTILHTYVCD